MQGTVTKEEEEDEAEDKEEEEEVKKEEDSNTYFSQVHGHAFGELQHASLARVVNVHIWLSNNWRSNTQ